MDTILWDEESDHYTERAFKKAGMKWERWKEDGGHYTEDAFKKAGGNIEHLLKPHRDFACNLAAVLDDQGITPSDVLDLGCAYGATTRALAERCTHARFTCVDPGHKSLKWAKALNPSANARFQQGHAHDLPFEDETFDLVILCMVLQWVPRACLLRTIAQIERVLRTDGVIAIKEFLPYRALRSQFCYNPDVYIFKNDYARFFTAFPWLREIHRTTSPAAEDEDHQCCFCVIRKLPIEAAYTLVDAAREEPSGDHS